MPRPITFFDTSLNLFVHAVFQKAQMVKSNEMKKFAEKKRFIAEKARQILLYISDSASSCDHKLQQCKKIAQQHVVHDKTNTYKLRQKGKTSQ